MATIYKSVQAKKDIQELYGEKLQSLGIPYQEIDVNTSFGRTRIIKTGNEQGKKIVLFHGINAGAPLTLEAVKEMSKKYLLFAIDTIGQATKSEEKVLNIKDNSYALWADEALDQLAIKKAHFVGISYGSYILQKLITHRPQKVAQCIFVVPSGLVNGAFWPSMTRLSWPLMRFMFTKKDRHLKAFIKSFVPMDDAFMFRMQKALLLGVKIDYRRPSLLKAKDVAHFTSPVHMIVADDDIFFPGDMAVKRARQIFKNLQEVHVIKNCKHMPHKSDYPEIQQQLEKWIG